LRKESNKDVCIFFIIFREEKLDVLFIKRSFVLDNGENFFRIDESEKTESEEGVVVDLERRIVL
jgi:hypothetical protein